MGGETIDRRAWVIIAGFGLLFSVLGARLFHIQIIQHRHLSQLALRQQARTLEVQPARGRIFDRQGRPLALNRQAASFFAVPGEIRNRAQTSRRLAGALGISAASLEKRLRSRRAFVWIARKTSDEQARRVHALKLPGVHQLSEPMRVYPEGTLASHVLGFVGLDNQGLGGVELQLDRYIRGKNGWIRINRDAKGREVPASLRVNKPSVPGQDVTLTLDKVIQHLAERELERGLELSGAKAGSVVVMDPRTGEILALANKPDFDPNHFSRFPAAARRNRAVTDVFEPGSTFKMITASAGLEETAWSETDIIDCENGRGVFGGRVVRDHEPRGRLTFRDVIVFSSNIGAVKIGLRLGAERLHHYAERFGMGRPTGIELPGESGGLLRPAGDWSQSTLASVCFGQGVAVTVLQMAAAYAAIANQGRLPRPWVVKELRRPDGVITQTGKPDLHAQAVSAATADRLRGILTDVVARGTGVTADIPSYAVAGKTGTAQKPLKNGVGYDPVHHVASFIGFFPADQPRLLIAVVIDEPRGIQWGGLVAGPIFHEVGRLAAASLGIPPGPQNVYALAGDPGKPAVKTSRTLVAVPDLTTLSPKQTRAALREAGLKAVFSGEGGAVSAQRPAPGFRAHPGAVVVAYLGFSGADVPKDGEANRVLVPDLTGQSLRNALQILSGYGLKARVQGSGIVHGQEPRPETWTEVGDVCRLTCRDPEAHP